MQSFTINTDITKEDFSTCQKVLISRKLKVIKIIISIVTIILAVKFAYSLDGSDLFFMLFLPILFLVISPKFAFRRTEDFYKDNIKSYQNLTYIITDTFFIVRGFGNESILNWNDFKDIIEVDSYLMLQYGKKLVYIMPNRSFSSDSQRIEFVEFVRNEIGKN